jgi:uncharacterized YccA/Bax inhibitor family protein
MFQSSNPTLSNNPFATAATQGGTGTMTAKGAYDKATILFVLLFSTATASWYMVSAGLGALAYGLGILGLIVALITGLVMFFKPAWAPVGAPVYALSEGLFLGFISSVINGAMLTSATAGGTAVVNPYAGIVPAAVILTFGVFALMLVLYRTGIIRPTQKFVMFMTVAIGAIALIYIANIVLRLVGMGGVPYINGSGVIGIGFSVVVVSIAALSLILDFGMIDSGEAEGAPKYMEWYGAYALMTSLVWLYIEILRLLMKLRDRD